MSRYNYNKNYFDAIDTPEKAYWFGFLCADGCITRFYKGDALRSMSVELTLTGSDTEHLQKYLDALEANVPIQHRTVRLKSTEKEYAADRVVVNNTYLCRSLIRHGCTPAKSQTLQFPSPSDVPREFISHFMRGYFDGDGTFFQKRYGQQLSTVWALCGTGAFLTEYARLLQEHGIHIASEPKPEGRGEKMYELRIHGRENIRHLFDFLYAGSTDAIRLSRKYEQVMCADFSHPANTPHQAKNVRPA